MAHRKPKSVSPKMDPVRQAAFIKAYHKAIMVRGWRDRNAGSGSTSSQFIARISILSSGSGASCAKNVTHNKCYAKFNDFRSAILGFLRVDVPKNWRFYCDAVSDNFRVILPKYFRVLM